MGEHAEHMEATFSRGLNDGLVEALNREYGKEDGWWRKLVDDKDTFVAIRDDRVNVYCRGCSLAEVWMESGKVVGQTHYKYLLRPTVDAASREYVPFDSAGYQLGESAARALFVESPAEVDALKGASRPFAGDEKIGVHEIIGANPNILDVEIALGMRGTRVRGASAPRIDFATLHVSEKGGQVVFFEAKTFANHKALRKRKDTPEVVSQIESYERLLKASRSLIEESYERVCCNLRDLDGIRDRHPNRDRMLQSIQGKPLTIDEQPRLVVFGFDNDQKRGGEWRRHRDKLFDMLGRERVLLKGSSKGFRNGISTGSTES